MPGYPRILGGPYGYLFAKYNDRVEMWKEHYDVKWTVWLDEAAAPQSPEPSLAGLSIGRFEDENTLVFESSNFSEEPWGFGGGVNSSNQKQVISTFVLADDGLSFSYSYTVTDPVYLTGPRTVTGAMSKREDRAFGDEPPCDPEVSSMHLSAE